jgi:hypothetical protein
MKKRSYILAGVLGATFILGGTAGFAKNFTDKISVRFANIKLIVNDEVIQTKAEPFIFNGNVYAPVATVANMLGIKQEWDNSVPAVRFSNSPLKKSDKDNRCGYSSMDRDNTFLVKCGRGVARPDGFYLDDSGKRIRFPFTGDTVIELVSPFLHLTDPAKNEDILIVERDTKKPTLVYLTVYKYNEGEFTKIDSFTYESTVSERLGFVEVLLGGDGGYTVYIQERDGSGSIATKFYEWDRDTKRYVLKAEN